MRRLALLALVALVAFPLSVPLSAHESAHGRWRSPRRAMVIEDGFRASHRRWDDGRWDNHRWDDDRWERREHARYRRYDCDEGSVPPRPLPVQPFQGRVELWLH